MKPSQYKDMETDLLFKRRYLSKIAWWKSILLIAPTLLLFVGIAGVIYVVQNEAIASWYMIPYAVVFVMGAAWLKAVKKHLQDKLLKDNERFLVCAARAIADKGGYYYFIFTKESKRHNEALINKLGEEIDFTSLSDDDLLAARKRIIEVATQEEESTIYIKAVSVNNVLKTNRENLRTGITPLLYVSPTNVFVIRRKDLPK